MTTALRSRASKLFNRDCVCAATNLAHQRKWTLSVARLRGKAMQVRSVQRLAVPPSFAYQSRRQAKTAAQPEQDLLEKALVVQKAAIQAHKPANVASNLGNTASTPCTLGEASAQAAIAQTALAAKALTMAQLLVECGGAFRAI